MNIDEFNELCSSLVRPRSFSIYDLENKSPRTLLYGYTLERDTWHLYIDDKSNDIVLYVYNTYFSKSNDQYVTDVKLVRTAHPELTFEEVIPSKRLYPEACDAEFCQLCMDNGIELPFTTFNPDRVQQQYYGEIV